MKRLPDESFEDYKKRRKVDQIITKVKLLPKLVWNSAANGTFRRGLDTLRNSRADQNRIDARKRKEERRTKAYLAEKAKKPTPDCPDVELWQQELPLGESND
jgi:hypothetical protein